MVACCAWEKLVCNSHALFLRESLGHRDRPKETQLFFSWYLVAFTSKQDPVIIWNDGCISCTTLTTATMICTSPGVVFPLPLKLGSLDKQSTGRPPQGVVLAQSLSGSDLLFAFISLGHLGWGFFFHFSFVSKSQVGKSLKPVKYSLAGDSSLSPCAGGQLKSKSGLGISCILSRWLLGLFVITFLHALCVELSRLVSVCRLQHRGGSFWLNDPVDQVLHIS